MSGPSQAFLGRQPIVDRQGDLVGYELLYRARATDDRADFANEDSASLQVLSTLLHDLGAPQVLAGKLAFINIGPDSLRDAGALVLLNPRRTVLELSRTIEPDSETIGPLALPEAVADALTMRQGRYGPLLDLAEALESGTPERVDALCANLMISSRMLARARRSAEAAVQEAVFA